MFAARAAPAALVLIVLAFVAAPAAEAGKGFRGYVSCNSKGKHADAFCLQGNKPVAVFVARGDARVAYKLCVRKAGSKQKCHERRTRKPGQRSRTSFDVDGDGKYKLAFFADGRVVERAVLIVRDRSLFLVGDSLSEGTKPYLPGALRGWSVSQSVDVSRFLPEGVSIVRSRSSLPTVTVFALGTNDGAGAVEVFRNSVDAVLGIVGRTRCVVVPTVFRDGSPLGGLNDVLRDLARRHDNLRVADWAGLVGANRGWLASDGDHVNATGYAARAQLIAKSAESCG